MIRTLPALLFLVCALSAPHQLQAQTQPYPVRPVTLVVPLTPGSPPDVVARLIAERLQASLGQPVVVENRTGADGMIAADFVAKSAPDGHTLLYALSGMLTVAPTMHAERLRYDPERDFAPISQVARTTFILSASPQFPADNITQFRAWAKANPRTAVIGHLSGVPSLMALRMKQATGVDMELAPYRGSPQIWPELMGGRIHLGLETLGAAYPQIKAGKLKAIAVLGSTRSELVPNVATVREQGLPEIEGEAWTAVLARAGTPAPAIERLNRELVRILALPDVQERVQIFGIEIRSSDPSTVSRLIREDRARWGKIIRDFNVKPEN